MRRIGIVGWKDSGKTGLVERLIAEFTARGLQVATVKHAHHGAETDRPGSDSARHAAAGASEVALVAGPRVTLFTHYAKEPPLEDVLARMAPADLVLIEGYKGSAHPKIEVRRAGLETDVIAATDRNIIAIASNAPVMDVPVPVLDLDDTGAVADFVLAATR